MKNILVLLATWISLSVYAQHTGIHFRTDSLHILLAEAKQKQKILFIDAYTSWCGPCKWMDAHVFVNDTVGTYYNEHFIAIRIDMEKGEGFEIAKKYSIFCYPTYLFVDGNGTVVHRTAGGMNIPSFIALGKMALDTVNNYGSFEKKHVSKTITTPDFIQYIQQRSSSCLPIDTLIMEHEQDIPTDSLVSRSGWMLLNTVIRNKQSRLFQQLIHNRTAYDTRYTADSVDLIIERMYLSEMYKYMGGGKEDTVMLQKLKDEVIHLNMPIADKIIAKAELERYLTLADWKRFIPAVLLYMKKYGDTENYISANDYAWFIYEHSADLAHLEAALGWVRYSICQHPKWFNTDTFASLLFALGKYADAKVWAIISITLGKEQGGDYRETEKLLEKIQIGIDNGTENK